jgi:hypothetical protein
MSAAASAIVSEQTDIGGTQESRRRDLERSRRRRKNREGWLFRLLSGDIYNPMEEWQ